MKSTQDSWCGESVHQRVSMITYTAAAFMLAEVRQPQVTLGTQPVELSCHLLYPISPLQTQATGAAASAKALLWTLVWLLHAPPILLCQFGFVCERLRAVPSFGCCKRRQLCCNEQQSGMHLF